MKQLKSSTMIDKRDRGEYYDDVDSGNTRTTRRENMYKCDSDLPCTHRKGDDCDFNGRCGGQVEDKGLTKITMEDLEENTTGGRWK